MNTLLPHIPPYEDLALAHEIYQELLLKPPLLSSTSIHELSSSLEKCHTNSAFILQSGDCAELFEDAEPKVVKEKLTLSFHLKSLLKKILQKEVICIDRLGGQFAKPRTNSTELFKGKEILSYFGDLFNERKFDVIGRTVEPQRLLKAYEAAKQIAFFVAEDTKKNRFSSHFLSHEALNLYYDKGLTRKVQGKWYNLSTHLPWLGARSLLHSREHIAYLATLQNPLGIKISPEVDPAYLVNVLEELNPQRIRGKLLLISRLGAGKAKELLSPFIQAVKKAKMPALWLCDPMHGNTQICASGLKTRDMRHILQELEESLKIHTKEGSFLSGIHLETTPEAVTECLDETLSIQDLKRNYKAVVDPRLNPEQAEKIISLFS